jgi:hypothetical protein
MVGSLWHFHLLNSFTAVKPMPDFLLMQLDFKIEKEGCGCN